MLQTSKTLNLILNICVIVGVLVDCIVDRCTEHFHFDIQVVDEILYIPIEKLFEHCFTDSPLYQQFVKNKKTYGEIYHSFFLELCSNLNFVFYFLN